MAALKQLSLACNCDIIFDMRELSSIDLNSYGITLDSRMAERFERYTELLLDWNTRMNLTTILDRDAIAVKHYADSLVGSRFIKDGGTLCDVGSGAGFPGIQLKITRDDLTVTLLDSLNKRITFLNEVIKGLELSKISAVHIRAEDAGHSKNHRGKYDAVTARAVAKMSTLLEYTLPLVKTGGVFIAYKGLLNSGEIEEAANALKELGGEVEEVFKYSLAASSENHSIVVVRKIASTPAKYPRGLGKERSQPL